MSMTTSRSANGYSADVQLRARIEGRTHPLSHVGPNEIILVEPLAINRGLISVDVVIDDDSRTYPAEIAKSFPAGTTRVPVTFLPATDLPAKPAAIS